jgi:hypothetical protein
MARSSAAPKIEPMFHDSEMGARVRQLENLIADLGSYPARSNRFERKSFAELFGRAQAVLEADPEQMAEWLGIDRSTVVRWAAAETAPHPIGRVPVFRVLAKVARRKVRTYEPLRHYEPVGV